MVGGRSEVGGGVRWREVRRGGGRELVSIFGHNKGEGEVGDGGRVLGGGGKGASFHIWTQHWCKR